MIALTGPAAPRMIDGMRVLGWVFGVCLVWTGSTSCSSKTPPPSDAAPNAVSTLDAGTLLDGSPAPVAKTPIAGLIDMQAIAWHNTDGGQPTFTMANVRKFPGLFGGIVINATWAAMQTAQDGAIDFTTVDAALAQVRGYNTDNPSVPLAVKLRIHAGDSAPDWAKQIGGGPVAIERNPKGCTAANGICPITVGRYWTAEYIAAWRTFQALIAAHYDDEPLIRAVAVTSCAPQTDEPFVPSISTQSKTSLVAAGYSDALDQACLAGAIDDYGAWRSTLIDFTFNVFGSLAGGNDATFPVTVMRDCRAKLGLRCVLDNHSLSDPLRAADQPVYDAIKLLGPPINFQTESPVGFGCEWTATIAEGISLGAGAIEVWPDAKYQGTESLTFDEVASLAAQFTSPIAVPAVVTPLPATCTGFR